MNSEISVLMATYNHAKYITQAVESIPEYAGIHITGSVTDDETKRILLGYDDSLVHKSFVRNPDVWEQKQMGLHSVWDSMEPKDRGHLICRLDSDDTYVDGWLAKAILMAKEILKKGKVPIIGPSYAMTDEYLNPINDIILPDFSMVEMLKGCIIPEYSLMPIGPVWDVGGYFDINWPVPYRYNFYAMMLRLLKRFECEVVLLKDIGFLYRQHEGQEHKRFNSLLGSRKNVWMQRKVAKHYFPEGWHER